MSKSFGKYVTMGICYGSNTEYYRGRRKHQRHVNKQRIEDENRPNQETFECIECGYESNADFNAANNIKNRVVLTVLRDMLLKQLVNGAYEPKNLKREKVKEVLLSFRSNLQKSKV